MGVGHLGNAMHVGHIAGHVGGRGHGDVLHLVLRKELLDLVVDDAALVVHLGVDHPAAVAPGQVVGVVLGARGEHHIVWALNQRRCQLVEAIGAGVDVEAGVELGVGAHEREHLVARLVEEVGGDVALGREAPADGPVGGKAGGDLVQHGGEGGRGGGVVEADLRLTRTVLQRDGLVDAHHVAADVVDRVSFRCRRSCRRGRGFRRGRGRAVGSRFGLRGAVGASGKGGCGCERAEGEHLQGRASVERVHGASFPSEEDSPC